VHTLDWLRRLSSKIGGPPHEKPVRVLAILSSAHDRAVLTNAAARRVNWDVSVVESLDAAAPLLQGTHITVFLLDRDLPHQNWRHVIREYTGFASCILLASTVTGDSVWREVVERGGYDVIAKPFGEDVVLRTIDQALRFAAVTLSTAKK
jgi:DNA-binding response OmpR family regulator